MKSKKILSLLGLLALVWFADNENIKAQGTVPAEVASIVSMNLDDAQSKLKNLGYEICASSFTGKKQDYYNESTKNCITIKFDKKSNKITEVLTNPETLECQKGLEASRKVWEKYHDGQAPVNSVKINEERNKLTAQGFKASYWIDEASPGRSSEYWINETAQKTMFIVWEIQGNKWVMTESTEYKMGHNPAPKK